MPTRILIAAVLGASMGFIGASVMNVALPTFQTELGADATHIQWIVSAYNLAIAALLLSAGAFSDRHGHLTVFRLGLLTYSGASVLCALAWDPAVLIIGRALQGLAGAMLVPSSLGLVNTAYAPEARGHAVGLWSSFSAVGAGMGPLFGGLIIAFMSWQYLFWVNLPIAAVAWWLLASERPVKPDTAARPPFDRRGALYSVTTLGLVTYAAIETSKLGLTHALVLMLLGAALVTGFLFFRSQLHADNPLVPLTLFRSRNFSAANLVTFLSYCSIGGGFYIMMLTWIQIQGYSPLAAGAITVPFMLFTAGFAHPVANLVKRIGPKVPLSCGVLLLGFGFFTYALPGIGTPFWMGYLPGVIITAIGIALLVSPVTTVVMGEAELRQSGIASGINSAVARSAILLSVAVLGAIHFAQFERTATSGLAGLNLDPATATHMARQLINMAAAEVPDAANATTAAAIRKVIAESFLSGARVVMLISAALSLLAAIVAFVYVDRPRRQSLLQDDG